ncbi:hypothetical protein ANN_21475 [Periplaneta americana]|uniref:Uncharacterized protein n=1 Tax=Periplaneta americana TaxID=6978 RepID=A0ABQ8SFD7_PERAM|nr:hypothetical protein ANN_21475 [Periplaneta americana]
MVVVHSVTYGGTISKTVDSLNLRYCLIRLHDQNCRYSASSYDERVMERRKVQIPAPERIFLRSITLSSLRLRSRARSVVFKCVKNSCGTNFRHTGDADILKYDFCTDSTNETVAVFGSEMHVLTADMSRLKPINPVNVVNLVLENVHRTYTPDNEDVIGVDDNPFACM